MRILGAPEVVFVLLLRSSGSAQFLAMVVLCWDVACSLRSLRGGACIAKGMRDRVSMAWASWHRQVEGFHANSGLVSAHLGGCSGGIYLADCILGKCTVFRDGRVVLGCLVLSTLARGWWLQDKRDEG